MLIFYWRVQSNAPESSDRPLEISAILDKRSTQLPKVQIVKLGNSARPEIG